MRKWHNMQKSPSNLASNKGFIPKPVSARSAAMTHLLRTPFAAIRITGPVVRAA